MILNSVRLPVHNNSSEFETKKIPLPPKVIISLGQSMGAPCEPQVKEGDRVQIGQIIGDSDARISVPVHSSVSGTVTGETQILSISGKLNRAVVINTDAPQEIHESVTPPVITNQESFLKAVRDSGSVGLGGAGFPTYAKLTFNKNKTPAEYLIINGAECEPFITGDYREIMENGQNVIEGIKLVMKYLDIPSAFIGIEKDKPRAIHNLQVLIKKDNSISGNITVKKLPLKYPQGAEKNLIHQTTGEVIKEGELPLSSGCIVLNVSTVSFLAEYIKTGLPLITRRVTIDGNIVNNAGNVFAPIGTPLEELAKHADVRKPPSKIILGGPMMGGCVYDMQTPVTKTTGAVLFFDDADFSGETACIRCGKCIHACSMNLNPYELNTAFDTKNKALLKKLRVNLCMSCAACSYICPAKRNVSERNQMAKHLIK